MLDKVVIHIKNVIFLKLVIYILVISLLLWLMPIFKEDYDLSIKRQQIANKNFSEAAVKLYSIIESESKILDTYRIYEDILNRPAEHICKLKNTIIEKVRTLALEYKIDPPDIRFSQIFELGESSATSEVHTKDYDVIMRFTTPDLIVFQSITKQIYSLMPENSIVTLVEVENEDFLDPLIISKLTNSGQPNIINVKFNMRIREVSVK